MTSPRMRRREQPAAGRLYWRVLVRTTGNLDATRSSRPLAWHLVACTDPDDWARHCGEGCRLLATADDPAGHCLVNGVCPRCALES
jgi:hypothetical protein